MVTISQPEVGRFIKQQRRLKDLTQQQLADLAGTTQAHIAKIEAGEFNAKGSTYDAIFKALEVQFVVKDAQYEINDRLETLGQSISDKIDLILRKMKIRQD